MCGINGIIAISGNGNYSEKIRLMNRALAHRGPDDEGLFAAAGIALGHRRLSIIDLSAAGHQPMFYDHERYVIVYNGELYNYRELKNELRDMHFATHTDTEVVLAAYAKWGTACLSHFNGMFSFAIWDKKQNSFFIARDRLGIKPLYYDFTIDPVSGDQLLVFSSEIRAVISSGFSDKRISEEGLNDYLNYQTVHAPGTILRTIKMLEPGHYMHSGISGTKAWWQPEAGKNTTEKNYETVCADVRQLLRDAVERRLIADVPFGAFLSGGIDSSAIVGLMTEVAASKVKTFSVVFDDTEFSEAVYARMVAKKFGTEHHEIKLSPDDFLHDLPAALDAMDHPGGDGPNSYVVSKATKQAGITMALSGLGGDELFAGYDIFKRTVSLEKKKWLNFFPAGIRSLGGGILTRLKPGIASEKMALVLSNPGNINFNSFYPRSRQVLLPDQIKQISSRDFSAATSVWEAARRASELAPQDDQLLSRVSIAEITTYMQNVLLRDADQMSMAHALEVRVPFLDYTLVEYVLNLPDRFKYPYTPKKLLVDSLGDLLPREIVDRPKMGFTFPWKNWMKNELRSFCEERLTALGKQDAFSAAGLQAHWNAFLNNDPRVSWSRIWHLVVLSHWLEKNGIEA